MIKHIFAAAVALLLLAAPAVAQEIIVPGGFSPPVAASCGTVTVSTPCLDLSQTWNAGGATFTGLRLTITDTASAAGSKPFEIFGGAAGTTSLFKVDKGGAVTAASDIVTGGSLFAGLGQRIAWTSSTRVTATVNGGMNIRTASDILPTVSGLGSASTAGVGTRATVSDATACASANFGATVTGGGSTACPVFSDGTNWKIG